MYVFSRKRMTKKGNLKWIFMKNGCARSCTDKLIWVVVFKSSGQSGSYNWIKLSGFAFACTRLLRYIYGGSLCPEDSERQYFHIGQWHHLMYDFQLGFSTGEDSDTPPKEGKSTTCECEVSKWEKEIQHGWKSMQKYREEKGLSKMATLEIVWLLKCY